eukprot:TRINITY_DN25047_c0_g1_i1.p1 TRINITY_DN25047_c0_g1~~TRINITY_DN25047_c0_g1_i1.p1  ORF type:complete len:159 (+),score=36.77 TRINITY_DN25047_c0_g1_i1:48-479(+)
MEGEFPIEKRNWKKPTHKLFKEDPHTVMDYWFKSSILAVDLEELKPKQVVVITSIKYEGIENSSFNPWSVIVYIVERSVDLTNFELKWKNEKVEKDAWDRVTIFRGRIIATMKQPKGKEQNIEFSVQLDLSSGLVTLRLWSKE